MLGLFGKSTGMLPKSKYALTMATSTEYWTARVQGRCTDVKKPLDVAFTFSVQSILPCQAGQMAFQTRQAQHQGRTQWVPLMSLEVQVHHQHEPETRQRT